MLRDRVHELEDQVDDLQSSLNELRAAYAAEDKDRRDMPDIYDIHRRVSKLAKAMDRYQDDLNYRKTPLTIDKLQDKIVKWSKYLDEVVEDLAE